jgi:hypothetical protein
LIAFLLQQGKEGDGALRQAQAGPQVQPNKLQSKVSKSKQWLFSASNFSDVLISIILDSLSLCFR